jgi:hypothetical protein
MQMGARSIYVRHTGTDGKSYLAEHRVWSTEQQDGATTLIAARTAEAQAENAKAKRKNEPALAKVEQITEDQYRQARGF